MEAAKGPEQPQEVSPSLPQKTKKKKKIHKKKAAAHAKQFQKCYDLVASKSFVSRKRKVLSPRKDQGNGKDARLHAEPEISVKCSLDESIDEEETTPTTTAATTTTTAATTTTDFRTTYQVKPLLILDLNGVLCRRIALQDFDHTAYYNEFWAYSEQNGEAVAREFYEDWSPPVGSLPNANLEMGNREKAIRVSKNTPNSLGTVAATPIVPCDNLPEVLKLLDDFCVGVWSSAVGQNVRQIVDMLFGERKDELMFVYGQEQCKCPSERRGSDPNNRNWNRGKKPVYMKPLARIFDEYHLWSNKSTIIFDDTNDKMKCNPKENVIIVENQDKLTECLKELKEYIDYCEKGGQEVDVRHFVTSIGQNIVKI